MECKIRFATFNVHCFTTASGKDNFERVLELVKSYNVDILCLQEAGKSKTQKLLQQLSPPMFIAQRSNCAILSRYPLEQIDWKRKYWPRYLTCIVHINPQHSINVTCLHLSHRYEPNRITELNTIWGDLISTFSHTSSRYVDSPKIIAGDFNSLTLEDYSKDKINNIKRIRRENHWEEPLDDVTTLMGEIGLRDTHSLSESFSGPISTCRFDTRIDYIFIEEKFGETMKIEQTIHVDDSASDHNMVITDIVTPSIGIKNVVLEEIL